jgi:dTDP-4-dehydrorhamnose reductase
LLDCGATRQALGLAPRHWRSALAEVLAALAAREH